MRLTMMITAAIVLTACVRVTPENPAPAPIGPGAEADQCRASQYQWLIGQPRSRIPPKPANATWRVTCTSCPVTMDYSPARLNIFYNQRTNVVESVRCG